MSFRTRICCDLVDLMTPGLQEQGGCCLHIVLDDENLETSNVDFCVGFAQEQGHSDCEKLATMMLDLDEEERKEVANYYMYG